jgi:glycosyltransferase involved in cell wall biosynthesis
MAGLTISIALCTYNGQAFLQQQLASLGDQTRRPDEVVASDDGSGDDTLKILESFARSAPFSVQILQNPTRLGPAQNFGRAIAACEGDIIALCDQDDIWKPNKLAVAESAFLQDPDLAFVFSDADVCDADGMPLGYGLWSSVGFVGRTRRQFEAGHGLDVLLRQHAVTGATLCFASKFRDLILPIDKNWMHDGWIALLLSMVGRGRAIDQRLIEYRQHPSQSIGAPARRSLYQQYLNAKQMDRLVFAEQAEQFEAALQRWRSRGVPLMPASADIPGYEIRFGQKIRHCRNRSAIRTRHASRLSTVAEFLSLRYSRFSFGWKSFAQDLFL